MCVGEEGEGEVCGGEERGEVCACEGVIVRGLNIDKAVAASQGVPSRCV